MKRSLFFVFFFLVLLNIQPAFGLEVSVDIKGPQDLSALKDGLTRTITARCLAKNVGAESTAKLNVSIIQMGSIISLDAILNTTPPRAFHKDLKNTDELSPAIDQMISEIFVSAPPAAAPPVAAPPTTAPEKPAAKAAAAKQPKYEVKLDFAATSVAMIGDAMYVSSESTVYKIVDGKPKTSWKAPKNVTIYRLYPYKGALLVLTDRSNTFFTYLIRDGVQEKTWPRCVVPSKDGLIAARVFTDTDFPDGINKWSKAETLEGSPSSLPEGYDVLTSQVFDISPAAAGEEVITFDKLNRISVFSGKTVLWNSGENYTTLASYLVTKKATATHNTRRDESMRTPEVRYYLKPRILVQGSSIICIYNDEGMTKFLGRLKLYDSSKVISYSYSKEDADFISTDLATIRNDYCADIALDKGNVLALVVKNSTSSFIQRLDLQ